METFAALLFQSTLGVVNFVCTDIAAVVVVLSLDVGFEVFVTQETLVTSFFSAWKGTLVGVRSDVHLQTNWTIESFAAFLIVANVILRPLRAGCGRDRRLGDGLGTLGHSW